MCDYSFMSRNSKCIQCVTITRTKKQRSLVVDKYVFIPEKIWNFKYIKYTIMKSSEVHMWLDTNVTPLGLFTGDSKDVREELDVQKRMAL